MSSIGFAARVYLSKMRRFSRDVRLFLLTSMLFGFSTYGGIFSVLLNLYLLRLGHGPESVGLVNAVGQFAFSISCLIAGWVGTLGSSRDSMIVGLGLLISGFGVLPLVEFLPFPAHLGWLLTTSAIGWLGSALYMVNGVAFLMNATGMEERTLAFSIRTALSPLAGFGGSLAGGLLPGPFAALLGTSLEHTAPYRYPLWIAVAILSMAPLVLLRTSSDRTGVERARMTGPRVSDHTAEKETFPYGIVGLIAVVGFFRCAGQGAASVFFNVYLDAKLGVPTALVGALASAGQLAVVPAVMALPLLVERFGTVRTVVYSSLGMALGLIPLATIGHWTAAGLGFVDLTALYSIASTSFTIYSQELVLPKWRAAMAGVTNMAAGLSGTAVALGGGYLIGALGYRHFFLGAAGLTGIGAALFWLYFQVPRGEYVRAPALERQP